MRQPTKIAKLLLLTSIILLVGCKKFKIELCILGDNGMMQCSDSRLEKEEYTKPYTKNYICTNPADFNRVLDRSTEELKKCKKSKRRF